MPLLLTESLDADRRELTHRHIETCEICGEEWADAKETWAMLEELPVVEVPPHVKARFLEAAGLADLNADLDTEKPSNVIPFHRRPAFKWVAQAAAVAVMVGGGWFAGHRTAPARSERTPAMVTGRMPIVPSAIQPISLSETRVIDASALSPTIEGRPDITNVAVDPGNGEEVTVSFDATSHWTVKGNPRDKSMLKLASYVIENEASSGSTGSTTIESFRRVYSDPALAAPEIASAFGKVLVSQEHEGKRIQAVESLKTLPPTISVASPAQGALIEAIKNDPNPDVRIKAIDALARQATGGVKLDAEAVNTLRQKAFEADENLYVRRKAAEALSTIKP
jgi:hypothetical protein